MSELPARFLSLEEWAISEGYLPPGSVPPSLPEGYISEHFRAAEFYCNHCGKPHPHKPTPPEQVLEWLETCREEFGGLPININSGYRCPHWNTQVGGAAESLHLQGQAVDHWIKGVGTGDMYKFYDDLIGSQGGVGLYSDFVHIDNRGYGARW